LEAYASKFEFGLLFLLFPIINKTFIQIS